MSGNKMFAFNSAAAALQAHPSEITGSMCNIVHTSIPPAKNELLPSANGVKILVNKMINIERQNDINHK